MQQPYNHIFVGKKYKNIFKKVLNLVGILCLTLKIS